MTHVDKYAVHWLVFRARYSGDPPKVITPRDAPDVEEWRRLGYIVTGPFVLKEPEQGEEWVDRIVRGDA